MIFRGWWGHPGLEFSARQMPGTAFRPLRCRGQSMTNRSLESRLGQGSQPYGCQNRLHTKLSLCHLAAGNSHLGGHHRYHDTILVELHININFPIHDHLLSLSGHVLILPTASLPCPLPSFIACLLGEHILRAVTSTKSQPLHSTRAQL